MKLFRFVYTVYPVGDLGGDIRPRQSCMIIGAKDEEEARGFFPKELLGALVHVDQREIGAGIIFQRMS